MINILFQVINVACLCFTVIGASVLAHKGDKLMGWYVYVFAATLGVAYFMYLGDITQLGIWIFFLANDFIAIRRKKKEPPKKYIVIYENERNDPGSVRKTWVDNCSRVLTLPEVQSFKAFTSENVDRAIVYELVEEKNFSIFTTPADDRVLIEIKERNLKEK